jgi:hypothetical protein
MHMFYGRNGMANGAFYEEDVFMVRQRLGCATCAAPVNEYRDIILAR